MAIDRELLREALLELVHLRTMVPDPARLVGQLYTSALEEWAGRLGVEARKLNKLVLVKELAPVRKVH
jgi:hypothetical protein